MGLLLDFKRDLEPFFAQSADALCIAGGDGRIKDVNPAAERALGLAARELRGRPFSSLAHPDDRARIAEHLDRLAAGAADMDGLETLRRLRAGPAGADLPVLMLSGDTSPATISAARALGARLRRQALRAAGAPAAHPGGALGLLTATGGRQIPKGCAPPTCDGGCRASCEPAPRRPAQG